MKKKLTVFMIDGTEFGPRTAEIGNWSGKAVYSQRSTIESIITREEFNNPGLYCLKSTPKDPNYSERIYIGESENIGIRLKKHLSDTKRDFFEIVFFISKDKLLTKTHFKYLESRMIKLAFDAKNAEIDNGNIPSIPTIHEADISDMEYFLDQIKLILPLMGFYFLVSTVILDDPIFETDMTDIEYYHIKTQSLNARLYKSPQGFVVVKGSQAKMSLSNSIRDIYVRMRERLISNGTLVEKGGLTKC